MWQAEARPLAKPDLESVKRAVADTYGIAVEDLASPGEGVVISRTPAFTMGGLLVGAPPKDAARQQSTELQCSFLMREN